MAEAMKNLPENIDDLKALVVARDELVTKKEHLLLVQKQRIVPRASPTRRCARRAVAAVTPQAFWRQFGKGGNRSWVGGAVDKKNLFNEAEAVSEAPDETVATEEAETTVPEHKRKKSGRRPLPEDLRPCEAWLRHDALSSNMTFPKKKSFVAVIVVLETRGARCRPRIGAEVSEQLDIKPPQVQVRRNVRYKYGSHPDCTCDEDAGPAVIVAAMPPQPIPRAVQR